MGATLLCDSAHSAVGAKVGLESIFAALHPPGRRIGREMLALVIPAGTSAAHEIGHAEHQHGAEHRRHQAHRAEVTLIDDRAAHEGTDDPTTEQRTRHRGQDIAAQALCASVRRYLVAMQPSEAPTTSQNTGFTS